MKTAGRVIAGLVVLLIAVLFVTRPAPLNHVPDVASDDLQALVADQDAGLVPGTEKRLTWRVENERTDWSVVYLHGFSASRQEAAPLPELVAESLQANLFETRLTGHGLIENGLHDVTAEQWLDDTAEALAVGRLIGAKTVVIAASTGATLALSLLGNDVMDTVDTLVMISPNFAPADPKSRWITGPGGPLLVRLVAGETRSWQAHNDLQERYWTTSYPAKAGIEVVRAVDRAERRIAAHRLPRLQVFYSPDDKVISVDALLTAYAMIEAPDKELVAVDETGAPSAHMIVGDIITPQNTVPVANRIAAFIRRQAP